MTWLLQWRKLSVNHCGRKGHLAKFQQKSLPLQQVSDVTEPRESVLNKCRHSSKHIMWCGMQYCGCFFYIRRSVMGYRKETGPLSTVSILSQSFCLQCLEPPVEPNSFVCLPTNKFDFLFSFHTWQNLYSMYWYPIQCRDQLRILTRASNWQTHKFNASEVYNNTLTRNHVNKPLLYKRPCAENNYLT